MIRLYNRTGPWFREGSLEYHEIDDLDGAMRSLIDIGLLLETSNGFSYEAASKSIVEIPEADSRLPFLIAILLSSKREFLEILSTRPPRINNASDSRIN